MELVLLVLAVLYFLPTVVALSRGHHNAGAIALTNILLGWTFLGWAAAMIWSVTAISSAPSQLPSSSPLPPPAPPQYRSPALSPPPLPGTKVESNWEIKGAAIFVVCSLAALPLFVSSKKTTGPPVVSTLPAPEPKLQQVAWETTTMQHAPAPPKAVKPRISWAISQDKSPVDDSPTVVMTVQSNETIRGRYGKPVRLELGIRCQENVTAVYVHFGDYFMTSSEYDNSGAVTYRVDQLGAHEEGWNNSTNHEALIVSRADALITVKRFLSGKRLLVRASPHGESPVTATFNIEGIDEAIKPLRAACGW